MRHEHYNGRKIPLIEVTSQVDASTPKYKSVIFDGADVNIGILNVKLFAAKGCDCVHCGLVGEYFRVERAGRGNTIYNDWHLNLYGIDDRGEEVLITKDHIVPQSKNGTDDLSNLQPMCYTCNQKKKSLSMDEFKKRFPVTKIEKEKHTNSFASSFEKVKQRMQLRYSINIDEHLFQTMVKSANKGRIVQDLKNGKSIREITVFNTPVKVLYCIAKKLILSAMENQPDEWFQGNMVPAFARHDQERAISMYNEIISRAKDQLKVFDTIKETAQHISSCDYPAVMFAMWKHPEHKVKISGIAWEIVRKKFNALSFDQSLLQA